MNAASPQTSAIRYGARATFGVATVPSTAISAGLLRELRAAVIVNVDARYNRHAGGEIQLGRWQRIEYQLYRHSLYNLDVVAAGILRGQQAERRTGACLHTVDTRSEEHTSELQSLMRISYAVFCLKK